MNLQEFFMPTSNEIPANNMPANDLGLNGFADFVEASVEVQTEQPTSHIEFVDELDKFGALNLQSCEDNNLRTQLLEYYKW